MRCPDCDVGMPPGFTGTVELGFDPGLPRATIDAPVVCELWQRPRRPVTD